VENLALLFVVALCVALAISIRFYKRRAPKYRRGYRATYYKLEKNKTRRKLYRENSITDDEDNQMTAVSNYDGFRWRRIFNREEARVFYIVKDILRDSTFAGWHVHGQVSWGAIIKTDMDDAGSDEADRAYRSINSKRADMVVTDNCGIPAAIIEYNGGGHYGDDPERTRKRDRVKVIAAEKADINLVKLLPAMDDQTKRQLLFKALVEYQIKRNKRLFVNSQI
jgi:hypothetical protein